MTADAATAGVIVGVIADAIDDTTDKRLAPGDRIRHADLGDGVVLDAPHDGWLRAFFASGERRVPLPAVQRETSRAERMLRALEGSAEHARRAWLCFEAHSLPLVDGGRRGVAHLRQDRSAAPPAGADAPHHHRIAASLPGGRRSGAGQNHRDGVAAARVGQPGRVATRLDGGAGRPGEQLAPRVE